MFFTKKLIFVGVGQITKAIPLQYVRPGPAGPGPARRGQAGPGMGLASQGMFWWKIEK